MKQHGSGQRPSWQSGPFSDGDSDPMLGFANIMDVMLVFALGLMLALISQSQELRQHFRLEKERIVETGQELTEAPESVREMIEAGGEGMESIGQVYRDPETGKLILVGEQ
ncbi:MAG: DUF2149 domain-containing protein [Pseudomonadota bacterium]